MKSLKYIALIGLLCAGLTSMARADLNFLGTEDTGNSGEAAELAKFQELTGDTDAFVCGKVEVPQGVEPQPGDVFSNDGFTVTIISTGVGGQISVEFDFTGEDFVVCGFAVKDGGGNVDNFYSVTNGQGVKSPDGGFILTVPVNGSLSHLTAFCCPAEGVPDGGATVMLLGAGLSALGIVRRYLKS